jgi:hypothetical protein
MDLVKEAADGDLIQLHPELSMSVVSIRVWHAILTEQPAAAASGQAPARILYRRGYMESFLIHSGYATVFLFGFLEACCVATSVGDVG